MPPPRRHGARPVPHVPPPPSEAAAYWQHAYYPQHAHYPPPPEGSFENDGRAWPTSTVPRPPGRPTPSHAPPSHAPPFYGRPPMPWPYGAPPVPPVPPPPPEGAHAYYPPPDGSASPLDPSVYGDSEYENEPFDYGGEDGFGFVDDEDAHAASSGENDDEDGAHAASSGEDDYGGYAGPVSMGAYDYEVGAMPNLSPQALQRLLSLIQNATRPRSQHAATYHR